MTDHDTDGPADELRALPIFQIPQTDGTSVTLDFTTPGPFGDFAFAARVPQPDGEVRERTYRAYHTDEAPIFVEILHHWARVAHPDDILAGLDRAEAILRFLTDGLEPTTMSENNFGNILMHHGVDSLAVMNIVPADHDHTDHLGNVITLAPRGIDLQLISRCPPMTTLTVPPSHLWVFVTGMTWRTYDHHSIPLSRLDTSEYDAATAAFRSAISERSQRRYFVLGRAGDPQI